MKSLLLLVLSLMFISCTPEAPEEKAAELSVDPWGVVEKTNDIALVQAKDVSTDQIDLQVSAVYENDRNNPGNFAWSAGRLDLDGSYEVIIPSQLEVSKGYVRYSTVLYLVIDDLYCEFNINDKGKIYELQNCFKNSGDQKEYYSSNKFIASDRILIEVEGDEDRGIVVVDAIIEASPYEEPSDFIVEDPAPIIDPVQDEPIIVDPIVDVPVVQPPVVEIIDVPEVEEPEVPIAEEIAEVEDHKGDCQNDREGNLRKCLKSIPAHKIVMLLMKGFLGRCYLKNQEYDNHEVSSHHGKFYNMIDDPYDRCGLDYLKYDFKEEILKLCKRKQHHHHHHWQHGGHHGHHKWKKHRKRLRHHRRRHK